MRKEFLPSGTVLENSFGRPVTIRRPFKKGGFSLVYLAEITSLDGIYMTLKQVIVKEFFPNKSAERQADNSVHFSLSEELLAEARHKFISETDRIAENPTLMSHPNIGTVIDRFTANGTEYCVVEYLSGGSLLDKTVNGTVQLKDNDVIRYGMEVCSALTACHKLHILHNDITPQNIVLDEYDVAHLIDFGIASSYDDKGDKLSKTFNAMTSVYAPPERTSGITLFLPESDIYSLAATLYFLLSGKIYNRTQEVELPDNMPLCRVLDKALEHKYRNRYHTAEEFSKELEKCIIQEQMEEGIETEIDVLERETVGTENETGEEPEDQLEKWGRYFLAALIAVLVMLGMTAIWMDSREKAVPERPKVEMTASRGDLLDDARIAYLKGNFLTAKQLFHDYAASRNRQGDPLKPGETPEWIHRCDTIIRAQLEGRAITPTLASAINGVYRLGEIHDGMAIMHYESGSYSIINTKGDPLTLYKAPDNLPFTARFHDGWLKLGLEYGGYINQDGDTLDLQYGKAYIDCERFSEGLAAVRGISNKYAYINTEGKEVIPARYDFATAFQEGFALVKRGGNWFYINRTGKVIARTHYVNGIHENYGYSDAQSDLEGHGFRDGVAKIIDAQGKEQMINIHGTVMHLKTSDVDGEPGPFSEGLRSFQNEDRLYGFENIRGEVVIPARYVGAQDFCDGVAYVCDKQGMWGIINRNGEQLVGYVYEYDQLQPSSEGFIIVKSEEIIDNVITNIYGVINHRGIVQFPDIYTEIHPFREGFALARKDGAWGYLDKYGFTTFDYADQP